ncbi:MAG: glycosyltransferase [Candidatus Kapaibacterium sp.]|jgi:glycosyltransferase involved in cell wall biosynthesis|nr:glycosyltransferase [Candidatus Kapabacteria bacterium]
MNNVLVVAYYFPPSGGPGVQRVLKHIKYLPEFGWNPIVLTVANGDYPAKDLSLMEQVPNDVKVYRTRIIEPYNIYRTLTGKSKDTAIDVNVIKKEGQKISFVEKLSEFIRSTFFIPDARIGWMLTVRKDIEKIFKENDIHAVYSSSPPYTCSIIGRHIKNKYKIPWIAGFRDPWTGFISSPVRWSVPARIDRNMEKSVFSKADLIECAWEGIIKDAVSKFPDLDSNKFLHIPNGFDSSDFPTIEHKNNDEFTITYTGSMYGRRNPQALFEAVAELINNSKIKRDKVKFKFIGRFGNEIFDMFEQSGFSDRIEVINYLPHSESINQLLQSDLLLLVVDESKESKEIVPGKVYEYIGVKKPILGIGPEDGAVGRLLSETNTGLMAHQSNVQKISALFEKFYKAWEKNTVLISSNTEKISAYERRNAAKMLATNLNKITNP